MLLQGDDAVKDKLLQIRVDADFLYKLEYLKSISGFKTVAETIRKIVEKEYRKEDVKVIRCEKCRHAEDDGMSYGIWCNKLDRAMGSNDWCSYGEEK